MDVGSKSQLAAVSSELWLILGGGGNVNHTSGLAFLMKRVECATMVFFICM
eukprot:CAMPEP_0169146678 /NCGR_PEP_ID=MMETSP1015-20121227/47738_1 /TAXON_ID=342587 /ORGANISM="Karlodinium micrum, Strain CCMP2283" /LENGTH=50 /DNA_ID=CAMNT_0009214681 /DNA_START=83 /DNA_END=235 /DNA_ORIENTATION=+